MKLINIITLWYLGITMAALLVGGFFIYNKLESEIDFELGMELTRQIDAYAARIENGVSAERLQYDKLEIKEIPYNLPIEELHLRDTVAYHDPMNRNEVQLKASKSYKINGKHYRISYYNLVVEADDITETVVITMVAVFAIQLVFIGFFFRIISKKILRPFHESLNAVQAFSFQKNEPLEFPKNGITEFEKLNDFLERMTKKLLKDYRQIKEFSENLSHEIQTPSAVIRGKLEHLINENITEKQAELISSAYKNNERITHIVRSLGMLAKLENEEFEAPETINLSPALEKILLDLEELIAIRSLKITTQFDPMVWLEIHPFVAEVLLSNLIGNAIRHNIDQGSIHIELNSKFLKIENTGVPPTSDPEGFLERFKKGSDHPDSVGLGLAIVNQICKNYGFRLFYYFENNLHVIRILFR
ncbi:sensor histidine kinase [Algoriphagus boritolerans]|uniref:histidine kinase n=1 Tax=Algoriphagus boritolerans DSM 17298 = JCM 18970 TaxID=1120964 RepID=A0A1H5RQ66_9BACT|nr:HAMP domain-containing sensor histidine kinase [Algoriphagus boritolerans]SEF40503.1 Signal transduction histidine kinase [Algoriphagus boritolerans DSM 17298 = JCM 18970]